MLKAFYACLLGLTAFGQAEEIPDWSFSVTPFTRYSFEQDLDSDNSFSVWRSGLSFQGGGPTNSFLLVGWTSNLEHANYDFTDNTFAGDFIFLDFRPSLSVYLNPDLGLYTGILVGMGAETGADLGDSMVYGGFVGFNYQIAPHVWVGTGIGFSTQLEDDPIILPLISLDWRINDGWSLSISGLRGDLSYKIDDRWSFYLEGRYDIRQYRLTDEAAINHGVLGDRSAAAGVGIRYSPHQAVKFSLVGGLILWREITLYDDHETKVYEDTAEPTGYVSANIRFAW